MTGLVLALALAAQAAPAPLAAPDLLQEVAFEGRVYFKDETLRGFMRSVVGQDLDEATLELDRALFEQRYRERGYLQAEVGLRVDRPGLPGQAIAVFEIAAGKRAELRAVHVNGNREVDDKALKEGFFSRPPEPLGGLTRAGFFHKPFLDQDGQRLIANYYRRGHLEARVTRTRVKAFHGLDGIEVSLDVIEGAVYELAGLELVGDLPDADPAELRAKVSVADGGLADLVTVQQESNAILDPLREEGHAFARFEQGISVAPAPSGRADRKAVVVTLRGVKGPAATVNNIRVVGNKGTQDHVISRDVTLVEGERYKHSELLRTQARLMGTGFFQQVIVRPLPGPEPHLVDIEVRVREQPTFLFNIAPAFIANEGLVGVLVLADRNLFGTGWSASLIGQLSAIRQLFDVSLTEPRLLNSRVSLTGEVHRRELGYQGFRIRSEGGGGVRVGVPIKYGFVFGAGATVEYSDVLHGFEGEEDSDLLPSGRFRNVLNLSLAYDRRDSVLAPRNGVFARVSSSYTGVATLAGVNALDVSGNLRLFWTPFWKITLKSNTQLGLVVNPVGGDVPVTDRYFLGGFGSVRGYFPRSIGPTRDFLRPAGTIYPDGRLTGFPSDAVVIGGTRKLVQNLEVEFPLWKSTPFRAFLFTDFGQAWSDEEALFSAVERDAPLIGGMFWSTGFGFLIQTPVFPFRFEWSVPLTRREFDRELDFFLGVGSAF
jgi:outer membrane protein insertion porin family